jgi:ATP-dependent DNA helicase RecG
MTELQASSAPIHPVFGKPLKTAPEVTMAATMEVTMEVKRLLNIMAGEHSRRELQKLLGPRNADHIRKAYLLPVWRPELWT